MNYEHKQDAEFVVGAPTDNCFVDLERGLYVEAVLFKENKYAQQMWELAKSVSKSGLNREIGFSIEGYIKKRNEADESIVEGVEVRNVALTKNPANPSATWEALVKSWEVGHEINPSEQTNATALTKENLSQAITTLSWVSSLPKPESDRLWKEVAGYLDESKKNTQENAVILLQIMKGLSKEQAIKYLDSTKGE